MARVLVTDAARGSAISIIRSLGQRGDYVVAADSDAASPGFRSRHAAARVVYPPPETAGADMVESLLRAAVEHRLDLIIPVTDEVIVPVADARERFAGISVLALADDEPLAASRNKEATLELAARLDVPTPRTGIVSTVEEARERAAALGWPIVLKPQLSRVVGDTGAIESMTVAYAGGYAGLAEQMQQFEGICPVLLQEYYPGEAHGVELLTHEGRPLAAFQHRRLREVPVTGGASSFRESVPLDPTLFDYAVRLLGALRWTGLAMVEFKLGARGPQLMEINGRIWGSLPLAVKSGLDFPARMVDLYLNGPPSDGPPDCSYMVGVRSRNLELETVWIASVLRRGRRYPFLPVPRRRDAIGAALRLLVPGDGFDVLDARDPAPGLSDVIKTAAKLRWKLAHAR